MRRHQTPLVSILTLLVACDGPPASSDAGDGGAPADGSALPDGSSPCPPLELASLAAGGYHTCGIDPEGGVWCWGDPGRGRLGRETDHGATPGRVALEVPAVELSLGYEHSCARLADGRVACWGRNSEGQLGDGSYADSTAPVFVRDLNDAIAIDTSYNGACAIRAGGALVCWGPNWVGQLGDGTTVNAGSPIPV